MPSAIKSRNLPAAGLQHPWVNGPPQNNVPDLLAGSERANTCECTLDGAGALAAAELVPAMAGYFSVLRLIYIRTDFTDPSVDFDFIKDGGGTLLAGGPYDLAFTQDKVNEDTRGVEMFIAAKTVNTALQVNITNGSAGGRVDIHFHYFYERP